MSNRVAREESYSIVRLGVKRSSCNQDEDSPWLSKDANP